MTNKTAYAILTVLAIGVSIFFGYKKYMQYSALAVSKMLVLESHREKDGGYNFLQDYSKYSGVDPYLIKSMKEEDLRTPGRIKKAIKEDTRQAYVQVAFASLTGIACSLALYILFLRRNSSLNSRVDSIFLLGLIPFWPLYNEYYDNPGR